jgi:hypothetical protein
MPELNLLHPFTMGDKAEPSVLFDGVPAVAHTHTPKLLWPHLSLTVFDLLTPVHILFGKQRCCMPRSRVLLKGEPAACCRMQGPESINTDCWVAGMIPSSYIVNYGTVCTDPDPEDFDLAAEVRVTPTFSDYLDDVGGPYPNPADLSTPLARAFSNRGIVVNGGSASFVEQYAARSGDNRQPGYDKIIAAGNSPEQFTQRGGGATIPFLKDSYLLTSFQIHYLIPARIKCPPIR